MHLPLSTALAASGLSRSVMEASHGKAKRLPTSAHSAAADIWRAG